MSEKNLNIVLMDDCATVRKVVSRVLKNAGFEVTACEFWDETRETIEKNNPDLLLLDVKMPYIQGDSIAYIVKRSRPQIKILYYSVSDSETLQTLVAKTGADGYICKSNDYDKLVSDIRDFMKI